MATKLTKPVSREIELADELNNKGSVIVTMNQYGLELRRKGTSRKIFIPWKKLSKVSELPGSAPARFSGNPFGWLVQK